MDKFTFWLGMIFFSSSIPFTIVSYSLSIKWFLIGLSLMLFSIRKEIFDKLKGDKNE